MISRHLFNWFGNLSSAIAVAVVARVAACFAGKGPLRAQPILYFTAHSAVLSSDFLNSKGYECRNNLVQESLEPRLDCSYDLANSSVVGNGLSFLAAPQSVAQFQFFVYVELHCCQWLRLLMG